MGYDLDKLRKRLVDARAMKAADFDQHKQAVGDDLADLSVKLIRQKLIDEESLSEHTYTLYGFRVVDLAKVLISPLYLQMIPKEFSVEHEIVAFGEGKDKLKVAMVNPDDLYAIEYVRKKINHDIDVYLVDISSFQSVIKGYKSNIHGLFADAIQGKGDSVAKDVKQIAEGVPIVKAVNAILEFAVSEGASDIHVEPTENETIIRFRIDGMLQDMLILLKSFHPVIVARIKIMADLKIDEHRRPQDGRIRLKVNDLPISLRVSIIPTYQGEKIVIRILDESARNLTLKDLGFSEEELAAVEDSIKRPNGMILVTGPTGSGKTTTLYTIMKILNRPEVNIHTIEDPIEYGMPRVNQMQVNPQIEVTFAKGLRSLLRQDPDIIMVGEIRDEETADMALHSSMTGHLVLSTLHTNDAPGAIPRFIDMGSEPFLLASTLNLIIAQRLVRKLCQDCKKKIPMNKERKDIIKQQLEELGIAQEVSSKWTSIDLFEPQGCSKCGNEGYKGRIGIFEVLKVTDEVKGMIIKKVPNHELRAEMIRQGHMPMFLNGLDKVSKGGTSLAEIIRVAKE